MGAYYASHKQEGAMPGITTAFEVYISTVFQDYKISFYECSEGPFFLNYQVKLVWDFLSVSEQDLLVRPLHSPQS